MWQLPETSSMKRIANASNLLLTESAPRTVIFNFRGHIQYFGMAFHLLLTIPCRLHQQPLYKTFKIWEVQTDRHDDKGDARDGRGLPLVSLS